MDDQRKNELQLTIKSMQCVSDDFYRKACLIGNHPFIEFTGVINEYIKACTDALTKNIDYTLCNAHTGIKLPLTEHQIDYINQKLECLFQGTSVLKETIVGKDARITRTLFSTKEDESDTLNKDQIVTIMSVDDSMCTVFCPHTGSLFYNVPTNSIEVIT